MTRHRWLIGVLAAVTAAMVLTGPTAVAAPDPAPDPAPALAWTPEAGAKLEARQPGLFAALRRDLHLDRGEALVRVGRSQTAHRVLDRLGSTLGRAYAGAWLDSEGAVLTVAVTDRRLTGVVRAAGARPRVVAHPLADLQAGVDRMSAAGLPTGIQTWYVDQAANTIVVETSRPGRAAGAAMVARAGVDPDLVRFVTAEGKGTMTATSINIHAGDHEAQSGCTTGFGVRPIGDSSATGFLTAGHCGPTGQPVRFSSQIYGQVATSTYDVTVAAPDRGWARITNPSFRATPEMNTFSGGLRTVSGMVTLVPGDFVCAGGRISKFRCGSVEVTNVPVPIAYKVGDRIFTREVTGLTRTTICGANGDSGAPVVGEGFRAAGVLVGVQGTIFGTSCAEFPRGPSVYQPIQPILDDFGLELLPPPSAPPPAALRIESGDCGRDQTGPGFTCYARWAGGVDPATASWQVTARRPAPYVITDPEARVTEAHFTCNYDQAESDYSTTVTVRDAVGAQASWSAYVCAW